MGISPCILTKLEISCESLYMGSSLAEELPGLAQSRHSKQLDWDLGKIIFSSPCSIVYCVCRSGLGIELEDEGMECPWGEPSLLWMPVFFMMKLFSLKAPACDHFVLLLIPTCKILNYPKENTC